jgi:hypothetical protein
MALQLSTAVRNAQLDIRESVPGVSANLYIRSGAPPADCATADSGTLGVTIALPSDWMNAASSGSKTKLGTWTATASATITPGHYRIKDSGGTTCHEQGTCGLSVNLTTSALTAANGNVLTFASTTGVATGMNISGTGVATGATVVAFTGTTVTMSLTSTAGVASSAAITFAYDLPIDSATITSGQTVTIGTYTMTIPNA